LNKSQDQVLELIAHEGGIKNEFAEFRIYYKGKNQNFNNKNVIIVDKDYFFTGKGIKLGVNTGFIRKIWSDMEFQIVKNSGNNLCYYFRKEMQGEHLKRYNMPIYYCNYCFNKEGRLILISFGFEAP